MENDHEKSPEADTLPRLGVSACLLGQDVRYNGGNCNNHFLTKELSGLVVWVSVCPEVEMGLGVPRETLRLVGDGHYPRLKGNSSGVDHTETMTHFSQTKLKALAEMDLHGFVFKKKSPSCGLYRIPIYSEDGQVRERGAGLFAAAFRKTFPLIPVEEEGRLNDPRLRETFIESIYVYKRWTDFTAGTPKARDLIQFHTEHKYQLLSHNERDYREMGRLVANAGRGSIEAALDAYGTLLMTCIRKPADRKSQTNVLFHLFGFLKNELDSKDKTEMVALIEDFRRKRLPLSTPLTLLKHHLRKFPSEWAACQSFLEPYPQNFLMRSFLTT